MKKVDCSPTSCDSIVNFSRWRFLGIIAVVLELALLGHFQRIGLEIVIVFGQSPYVDYEVII